MSGAHFGLIIDEKTSWPDRLVLDRCSYGGFTGEAPVDADARIRWLELGDKAYSDGAFRPQPWEECARVLREGGHGAAARAVLIRKEKKQRAARRQEIRARRKVLGWPASVVLWAFDFTLGITIRYGRRPLFAFLWLGVLLAAGWGVFHLAEAKGALKPNLPQVQRAPEWVLCGHDAGTEVELASVGRPTVGLRQAGQTQYGCYLAQPEAASYPRFNAFIYSADTLLPVVSLEMQSYWLPDDSSTFGWWARIYLWLQIAAGWGLTLLAVAGFSGLVKQDST
jgi:hypothetical protein